MLNLQQAEKWISAHEFGEGRDSCKTVALFLYFGGVFEKRELSSYKKQQQGGRG